MVQNNKKVRSLCAAAFDILIY